MIKVKVEKEFIDKHSGELHQVGAVLTINEDRLKEIQSVDPALVVAVVEAETEQPKKKRTTKKGD